MRQRRPSAEFNALLSGCEAAAPNITRDIMDGHDTIGMALEKFVKTHGCPDIHTGADLVAHSEAGEKLVMAELRLGLAQNRRPDLLECDLNRGDATLSNEC